MSGINARTEYELNAGGKPVGNDVKKIQADAIRWLAQQHFDECLEDRPIQNWMRIWADKVESGWIEAKVRGEK